jgi:hypothetical protein
MKSMLRWLVIAVTACLAAWSTAATCASGTTCGDLIHRYRMVTQEPDSTTGYTKHSNTEVRYALSCAQRDMAPAIGAVERETTYTLVAGTVCYKLPYRYFGVEAVYFISGVNFNRVNYQRGRDFPSAKVPGSEAPGEAAQPNTEPNRVDFITEFSIFGDSLKIYPDRGSYPSKCKLRLDYYRYPAPLDSNSQVSEMPEYTDLAVIKYAEYLLNSANLTIGEETSALTNIGSMVSYFIERYAKRAGANKVQ